VVGARLRKGEERGEGRGERGEGEEGKRGREKQACETRLVYY